MLNLIVLFLLGEWGKKKTSLVLQSTLKMKLFLLRFSEHAMLASGITWFEIYLEL